MRSETQRWNAANNLQEAFLRVLADALRRELKAQQVILFGSHARGEATTESDIDLLVIAPVPGNFYQRMAQARKVLRPFRQGRAITPIVLTPEAFERLLREGNAFILSVIHEGVVIE